jgi:hypothetical protein
MTPKGKVIFLTAVTWLPILPFIYLPNTFWGVALKIIAGIFLASLIYNFTLGPGLNLYGSAGAGFILNAIWFTIINLRPPRWVGFILWLLILTGLGTCHAILKRMSHDKSYNGMDLYDKDRQE